MTAGVRQAIAPIDQRLTLFRVCRSDVRSAEPRFAPLLLGCRDARLVDDPANPQRLVVVVF